MTNRTWLSLPLYLSDEFFGDVLVCAFDGDYGGCNYWATDVRLTDSEGEGADKVWKQVEVHEVLEEVPEKKLIPVNRDNLIKGLQTILSDIFQRIEQPGGSIYSWEEAILESLMEHGGDAGCIDADAADNWVQMTVFGAITYG